MNPNDQRSLMNTLGYGSSGKGSSIATVPYAIGYSPPPKPAAAQPAYDPYAYQKQQLAQGQALLDEIRKMSAPKPFVYSNFDTASNSAKARSQAEQAVNPLYTKKLQDFLDSQRTLQARQQEDAATAQKTLEDALNTTLQANELTKTRTGQDVATNIGQINTQGQQFQQDTGQQFNDARLALLRSGQTGVGLGAQQVAKQQAQRNTQEGRQVEAFNQAKQQQELYKTRTFEDIAKSSELATKGTGEQKKAVQLSLARYIQDSGVGQGNTIADIIKNSGTNIKSQANALEAQRLQDILGQQGQYEKANYLSFLNTLTGQNKVNTAQVYNGLF